MVGNGCPKPALLHTNLQMATSLRAGRWLINLSATYWVYILRHAIWPLWPQLLLENGNNYSSCLKGLLGEFNKIEYLAEPDCFQFDILNTSDPWTTWGSRTLNIHAVKNVGIIKQKEPSQGLTGFSPSWSLEVLGGLFFVRGLPLQTKTQQVKQ